MTAVDPGYVGGAPSGGPAASTQGPSPTVVFWAVYRLLLRSVATTGRLVAVGLLAAISVLTALAADAHQTSSSLDTGVGYVSGNLVTLVPVAVLVFASATLGDLMDDGSLVYLWLRPVSPKVHLLAAWAATVSVIVPLVLAPLVLATAVIDSSPDLMAGTIVAGLVAVAAYSALFVTGGIRFRRALPWGLVYILIWEGFIASAGKSAAKLAVRSYVRSILSDQTGVRIKLAVFSTSTGIIVPLLAGALALWYGSRRLAHTDVP